MKKNFIIRILIVLVLTIVTLITLKSNTNFKTIFYKNVYDNHLSFAKVNNWYQSKFGTVIPFSDFFTGTMPVFKEELKYSQANLYKDGVSLNVGFNYLVPVLNDGIVIFKGIKEGYGNTIIISQSNGIEVRYSNLKEINVKLYDYVKKGSLVGVADEHLYLVFVKDGEVIDYKEYI
ncbi:MAG: M23 family metallopeptidase [Bacilli bacterium]